MKRFFYLAALGLSLAPTLTFAQEASVDAALAKAPEVAASVLQNDDALARATGLMALCPVALKDPKAAIAAMEAAGWSMIEGGADTLGFDYDGSMATMITIGINGGYCDVVTEAAGTADLAKNFFDTMDAIGWPAFEWTGDEGCISADLAPDMTAAITGFDGCPAADGAAIVFESK